MDRYEQENAPMCCCQFCGMFKVDSITLPEGPTAARKLADISFDTGIPLLEQSGSIFELRHGAEGGWELWLRDVTLDRGVDDQDTYQATILINIGRTILKKNFVLVVTDQDDGASGPVTPVSDVDTPEPPERLSQQSPPLREGTAGGEQASSEGANTPPVLTVAASPIAVNQAMRNGLAYILKSSDLQATDVDSKDGPANLTYMLTSKDNVPSGLNFNVGTMSAQVWRSITVGGRTFTQADIDAGRVGYFASRVDEELTFTVTDSSGASSGPKTLRFDVTPYNKPPRVGEPIADWTFARDSVHSFWIPENAFEDMEGDDLTYELAGVTKDGAPATPTWFRFRPTGFIEATTIRQLTESEVGTYVLTVSAYDGKGTITAPATTSFTVNILASSPMEPDAGINDRSVAQGSEVSFSIADSFTGNNLSYIAWISGDIFGNLPDWLEFNMGSGVFTVKAPPDEAVGDHTILVQATGSSNDVEEFTLTITNTNDSPYFDFNLPNWLASVGSEASYTFREDSASDPDLKHGDRLTYSATVDGASPSTLSWIDFNMATRTFTLNQPGQAQVGRHTVEVTATDISGATSSDELFLTVRPASIPPPDTPAGTSVSIYESFPLNKVIHQVVGPDGTTPSLADNAEDNNHFTIDAEGNLRWKAVADYEAPADRNLDNVYRVEVSHTPSSGAATKTILDITVLDIEREVDGTSVISVPATSMAGNVYSFRPASILNRDVHGLGEEASLLLWGAAWTMPADGPLVLTWSFETRDYTDTGFYDRVTRTFSSILDTQAEYDHAREVVDRAFRHLEQFINVKFIEVAETEDGTRGDLGIEFVSVDHDGDGQGDFQRGQAFLPEPAGLSQLPTNFFNDFPLQNISFFFAGPHSNDIATYNIYDGGESNNFRRILHEISHTLGLKHPFSSSSYGWPEIEQRDSWLEPAGSGTIMDYGGLDSDTLQLGVRDIEALQFLYGPPIGKISVEENIPAATAVFQAESAVLPQSRFLSKVGASAFSLAAGVHDNDLFTIDADDGEVRFKLSPDYENPQDGARNGPRYDIPSSNRNNEYNVSVSETFTYVRRSSGTTREDEHTKTVQREYLVKVTDSDYDPNMPPRLGTTIDTQTFSEGVAGSFQIPDSAFEDNEEDDTLTYALVGVTKGGATVTLAWLSVSTTGLVEVGSATDDADVGTYRVTVSASDGVEGNAAAMTSFDLVVANVYEPPSAPTITVTTPDLDVTEDTADTTAAGTSSATDPDAGSPTFTFQARVQGGAFGTGDILGRYGTLNFNAEGVWSYALNNANTNTQALDDDDTVTDETFEVRAHDGTDFGPAATLAITVRGVNDAPSLALSTIFQDPRTDLSVTEDSDASAEGSFRFSDVDTGDAASAWRARAGTTGSYAAGSDTAEGGKGTKIAGTYGDLYFKADGTWTYELDGNAATTDRLGASAVETDAFQVLASDGTVDADPATLSITVNGANDAPVLDAKQSVTMDAGGAMVLDSFLLDSSDPDSATTSITYTVTSLSVVGLQASADGGRTWDDLDTGANNSFTPGEMAGGQVRVVAPMSVPAGETVSIGLMVTDGDASDTATMTFSLRQAHDTDSDTDGGDVIIPDGEDDSKSITTGAGNSRIVPGAGNDRVDPGAGNDVTDLSRGGADEVVYRVRATSDGEGFVAWDGGDVITGFKPGEDRLLIGVEADGTADAAAALEAFVEGLGNGYSAIPAIEFAGAPGADRTVHANWEVAGITLYFAAFVVLPGGGLGGSTLRIRFDEGIPWPEFNADWLDGGKALSPRGRLKGDEDGQAALEGILGLGVVSDTPRPTALILGQAGSGGSGTADTSVTIDLDTGNNDDTTATGRVTATRDSRAVDGAVFSIVNIGSESHGDATIDANGDWTYTLTATSLSASTIDNLMVTVEQGGDTATFFFVINITVIPRGDSNTAPVVDAITGVAWADTRATDDDASFPDRSGTFTVTDPDNADNHGYAAAFGATAAVVETSLTGFTHRVEGTYSTLHYNADGTNSGIAGAWRLVAKPDAINGLAAAASETDTFTVTAHDDFADSTNSQDLVLTVTGSAENALPTAADASVTITANGEYSGFEAGDFNFFDGDGGSLASIVIATLPSGTLKIGAGGEALVAGTRVTQAQIPMLVYTPASPTASADDSFTFRVNDGEADSTQTYTFSLVYDVVPMFAAPAGGTVADTPATDTEADFTNPTGDFGATDPGDTLTYMVSGQTTSGRAGHTHMATGSYGTLHFHETTGEWTYDVHAAAVDALDDSRTDSFAVTVTDSDGNPVTRNLVISVTGVEEADLTLGQTGRGGAGNVDTSVTLDLDTGNSADTAATGRVTASRDSKPAAGATFSVTNGAHGNASIDANGDWTYTLTATADPGAGSRSDTITVTVTQGGDTETLDIAVAIAVIPLGATANAPMVNPITGVAWDDTMATDDAGSFPDHSGTFTANDPDNVDGVTFNVAFGATDAVANTSRSGYTHRVEGIYSTLFYNHDGTNSGTVGAWLLVAKPAAIDGLADSVTMTDTFTVTAHDGTVASTNSQDLVLTVSGENDNPGTPTGMLAATVGEDGSGSTTKTVTATDDDDTSLVFRARAGSTGIFEFGMIRGTYGVLEFSGNGSWTYNVDENHSDFDTHNQGAAPLTDLFEVVAWDGRVRSSTPATLTISISGADESTANTAPALGHTRGMDGLASVDKGFEGTRTGILDFGDDNPGDPNSGLTIRYRKTSTTDTDPPTANPSVPSTPSTLGTSDTALVTGGSVMVDGMYGTFTLTRDDAGTISWSYDLNEGAGSPASGLRHGDVVHDVLYVQVSDGSLSSDVREVVVTIEGADDTPGTDNPPAFARNQYYFWVDENDTGVVGKVQATDSDGTSVTYAFAGYDYGFSINSSGEIRRASLDHETASRYDLTVAATSNGRTTTANVVVMVDDVNEAPSLAVSNVSLDRGEVYRLSRRDLQAIDEDVWDQPRQLTYRLDAAPSHGRLEYRHREHRIGDNDGWNTVNSGGTFTQEDIDKGFVRFVAGGEDTQLSFTVTDPGGASSGTTTLMVDVPDSTNTPPIARNQLQFRKITVNEGVAGSSQIRSFRDFRDAEDSLTYTIVAVRKNGEDIPRPSWLSMSATGLVEVDDTTDDSDVGTYAVVVGASDGHAGSAMATGTLPITIRDVNEATPVLEARTSPIVLIKGQRYSLTESDLRATDADSGDGPGQLTYTVTTIPTDGSLRVYGRGQEGWYTISNTRNTFTQEHLDKGLVSFRPGNSDVELTFTVTDSGGRTSEAKTLEIDVTPNTPPRRGTDIADWTFTTKYRYVTSGFDDSSGAVFWIPDSMFEDTEDDDSLSYSLVGVTKNGEAVTPRWLEVQRNGLVKAGERTAVIPQSDTGTYTVTIAASDGVSGNSNAENSFDIVVLENTRSNRNRDTQIADKSVAQGSVTDIPVANAFPGTGLTYKAWITTSGVGDIVLPEFPDWLSIDSQTGVLTIDRPPDDAVGKHTISIQATGSRNDIDELSLTITNVNDAPEVFLKLPNRVAAQGDGYAFALSANAFSDPDLDEGDSLSYSVTVDGYDPASLAWIDFDYTNLKFTIRQPGEEVVGRHNVVATATDKAGLSVSDSFVLTVMPRAAAPATPADAAIEVHELHPLNKAVYWIPEIEGATASLAVGVEDNDLFTIGAGGRLLWRDVVDYETPLDANMDNVYRVEISYLNGDVAVSKHVLDITVLDIAQEVNGTNGATVFSTGPDAYTIRSHYVPEEDLPSEAARYVISGNVWAMPDVGPLILTWSLVTDENNPDNILDTPAEHVHIRALMETAFREFERHANIKFIEVAETDDGIRGDISIEFLFPGGVFGGIAFDPPTRETQTYFTFAPNANVQRIRYFTIGENGDDLTKLSSVDNFWRTILHEIGHTMGLKHPWDGGWAVNPDYEALAYDRSTLMDYGPYRHNFGELGRDTGLGSADIEALQFLYGRPGDDWRNSAEQYLPYSTATRDLPETGISRDLRNGVQQAVSVNENIPVSTVLFKVDPTASTRSPAYWTEVSREYSLTIDLFDNHLFTIDADDGEVRFKESPDFENPFESTGGLKHGTDNDYYMSVTETLVERYISSGRDETTHYEHEYWVFVEDVTNEPPDII